MSDMSEKRGNDDGRAGNTVPAAEGLAATIRLSWVALALACAVAAVAVAGTLAGLAPYLFGADPDRDLVTFFDLGVESNLPTWFSSALLLINAGLAAICYVGGALGTELALGAWSAVHGEYNAPWVLINSVQETGEMTGLAIFLLAQLRLAAGRESTLRITLGR